MMVFSASILPTGLVAGHSLGSMVSSVATDGVGFDESDGKIVAVGYENAATNNVVIARYTSTGAFDTSNYANPNGYLKYNTGTSCQGAGVAIQSDDKAVIVGQSSPSGVLTTLSSRVTTAGALDQ